MFTNSTKPKSLTQRQSNGEPEQEISGKFKSDSVNFSKGQVNWTISLSDLDSELDIV